MVLAAAKAICFDAKKDVDGKVAGYVAKVLALSEAGFDEPLAEGQEKGTARLGLVFSNYLPLWHAMKLASRIEGAVSPDVRQIFNKRLQSLEKLVKDAEAKARSGEEGRPRRALQMYDQLKAL
ncbi:MAG: hypothetical protein M1823_007840 [Watsoniomyces obsoletus]|nr:MAG: hypothetical protein M1823_007840 [Watsoniomyces obsoletus]